MLIMLINVNRGKQSRDDIMRALNLELPGAMQDKQKHPRNDPPNER